MAEQINYWSTLEEKCPIDIRRIVRYAKEFETFLPEKIGKPNLNKSKENLLNARSCLDSMIISLMQLLYDQKLLEKSTDYALFWLLSDNIGRLMRRLDEDEEHLLIKFDEPNEEESRVGVSRISAYSKILKTTADTLIYECLLKSTEEYNTLKKEEIKERKFLYILFQMMQVTLTILGGITREKGGGIKKGTIVTQSPSWRFLMTPQGQKAIKEGYKQDTGIDVSEFDDLENLNVEAEIDESDIEDS